MFSLFPFQITSEGCGLSRTIACVASASTSSASHSSSAYAAQAKRKSCQTRMPASSQAS